MSVMRGQSDPKIIRDILGLVIAVLVTRWLFRIEYLVHMDSVNFALGIINFDPESHQPHPPGYFLYILLGKMLNYLVADPAIALLLISIFFSATAVAIIYLLTREWFGRTAAIFSGLLFIVSPFTWFYGIVGLTYIVEFCLISLVGLLCWYVSTGRKQYLIPAAVVMGIAVGFRQSSIIFLAPLCLYSIRHLSAKYWIAAIAVFLCTVLAWFIPMLASSGGSDVYFSALNDLWSRVPSARTVFAVTDRDGISAGVRLAVVRLVIIAFYFAITFSLAAPLVLMRGLSLGGWGAQKRFLIIWVVPGLLFFVFVFMTFTNMGYMASIFPPLFAVVGAKTARWYEQLGSINYRRGFVSFLLLANTAVFIFVPYYIGYLDTKSYVNDIVATSNAWRNSIKPDEDLVIAIDAYRYGFREAGYYLPEYFVVQYPEMKFSSGIKVFAMRNRSTVLLNKIPVENYSRFLVYPLHSHDHAQDEIWKLFPEGAVSRISINGNVYLEGPIENLKYLFPHTAN